MVKRRLVSLEAMANHRADVALAERFDELLAQAQAAEQALRGAQANGAAEEEQYRVAKRLDSLLTDVMRAAFAAQRAAIGPRGYDDRIYRRKALATPKVRAWAMEAERLLTLRESHRLTGIPRLPRRPVGLPKKRTTPPKKTTAATTEQTGTASRWLLPPEDHVPTLGATTCTYQSADKGSHCPGRRVDGFEHCLAHLTPMQLDQVLQSLRAGDDLNASGAPIGTELLTRIFQTLNAKNQRPRLRHVSFINVTFLDGASFKDVQFTGSTSFDGAQFTGGALFEGAQFDGDASFDGAQFAGAASFDGAKFAGAHSFNGAQFTGVASFDRAQFSRTASFKSAKFTGGALFEGAEFTGAASFDRAQFTAASFDRAKFTGDASFEGAEFAGPVSSARAEFTGDALFKGAQFAELAWFHSAQFIGDATFDGAKFDGDTTFEGAKFTGTHSFNDAKFAGAASFARAQFSRTASFHSAQFTGAAAFNGARFTGGAMFDRAQFTGRASFEGAEFVETAFFASAQFTVASFDGVQFTELVSFDRAQFTELAWFGSAEFRKATSLGPLTARILRLNGAVFDSPLVIEAASKTVSCTNTKWNGGVTLRLWGAVVDLEQASFAEPSFVTGSDKPIKLDEDPPDDTEVRKLTLNQDADSPESWMPGVETLRGTDTSRLSVTDVNLSRCHFAGALLLDQLRLEGRCVFDHPPTGIRTGWAWPPVWRWSSRQSLAEERDWRATTRKKAGWTNTRPADAAEVGPERLAVLYRQLRKAHEDAKNEPGAADFYYGEMEMRRHARATPWAERLILMLYWSVSGYGLRATRAFITFAILISGCAAVLRYAGFPGYEPAYLDSLLYAGGSVLSLGLSIGHLPIILTRWGDAIRILLRIAGPVLLGLAALALRGRIKR